MYSRVTFNPNIIRISGGDGERENQPNGDDQPDQQEQGQQDDQQSEDGGGDSSQGDGNRQDSGPSDHSIEDQLDAEKKRNIQLTKQLNKANEDKKKGKEDADAAKERDEYKGKYEKVQGLLDSKYLIWSIATNKKYDWNDPEDVVKFIKTDEINIDIEKGEVEGLDLALKRIAKEKSYLLVQKTQDDQEQRPPSGSHPFGSKPGDRVTEEKRLGEKYKIPGFGSQNVRPL